jgi:hypothetical protein
MVAHQAIGMHLPLRLLAGLCQRCQQSVPVLIIGEDGLLPIAAVHDARPAAVSRRSLGEGGSLGGGGW